MRAIEEYENYQRGIYSGALGYIKPDDDFDFNPLLQINSI
jgi:para-aminobenzoate synthetase component 1